MPTRNLGKTGYKVGIFSLGGQASLERPNNFDVAVPIIDRALDMGVNYIDTSSIYGGPERWSEQYLGKALKGYRDQVFIASKTKERTRDHGAVPHPVGAAEARRPVPAGRGGHRQQPQPGAQRDR
jgi:hypothetical protein